LNASTVLFQSEHHANQRLIQRTLNPERSCSLHKQNSHAQEESARAVRYGALNGCRSCRN
ncbi:MAG: hypothetical protein WCE50_19820, partial [Candidatus Acidiferrum sp.]